MPTSPTISLIEHLCTEVLRDGAGPGDGELLGRYLERRDEAAIAALVRRHGPMVWGVCRRLLNHHDAEDAFQATFLVLVRKAASIVPRDMVGNWLYGVAHQTALQTRRAAARRRTREVQVKEMPDTQAVQHDRWLDVQPLLDQELSLLPDRYRAIIVLCDLEGRTRKEVARQLAVPEGTVAGRLARARAMLARRLVRRGVELSGVALPAVLAQSVASAALPNSVAATTIRAASSCTTGQAAGLVSVKVAALVEGVLKAMMLSKLKSVVTIVLVLGSLVTGASLLTGRMAAVKGGQPPAAAAPTEAPQKQEKERFTAWGKEVGGLQAGLGYHPGQKRAYAPGQTVKLVVRVRNVIKEEVKFQYLKEFFIETPPIVTDDNRKPVSLRRRNAGGLVHVPVEVNLAPGKEIDLAEVKLEPRTQTQSVHEGQWNMFETGTFSVQYEQLSHPDTDRILGKLATGKLELVIKFSSRPAAPGEETPQKKDREVANTKPIKIRVYIEKVHEDTSTITASCMLIGEFDNVTKPLRLEHLRVSEKATIMDRGNRLKLKDLKLLPRDTHFYLFLKSYEEELGFEVVGIETIRR
jgi:RNA polymerase sigma factor (sigma-70 family)